MALTTATRRPVTARTTVSRQRTSVVRCSAQQPSSMTRNILAAGAALALVLGPSTSPVQAFSGSEAGDRIKDAANKPVEQAQGLGEKVKQGFMGFGDDAKGAARSAKDKAPGLDVKGVSRQAEQTGKTLREKAMEGLNVQRVSSQGKQAVQGLGDKAKQAGDDAKANLGGIKLPGSGSDLQNLGVPGAKKFS